MDDVLCDFSGEFTRKVMENPRIPYPQSQYGFYRDLSAIKGAVSATIKLLNSDLYSPYILTAPSVYNPLCYTEKRVWVEKHLGMEYVNRLIISPNKSLLKGDYLIDDKSEGRGQEGFEGELIQFGTPPFEQWKSVLIKLNL